jgi:hypothetical protein
MISFMPLADILAETPILTEHLDPLNIEALMDPANHLGSGITNGRSPTRKSGR